MDSVNRRGLLRSSIPAISAVLGGGFLAACREEPIRQPVTVSFVSRGSPSERTQQIMRAAAARGWTSRLMVAPSPNRRGVIEAVNNTDGHNVVVRITYNSREFTITYVSSIGLNYDGRQIHTYYNGQVERLEQQIMRESA